MPTEAAARRARLSHHRETLLLRSAVLRERFAVDARTLQGPMAVVDLAGDGVRWLRRNPAWPLGAAAIIVVARPRALLRWTGRGIAAWRLWRRLRPWTTIFWRRLAER